MNRLEGKVAIITGAAQGMGRAHARRFAAEGAQVMLSDIQAGGSQVAAEIGVSAAFAMHDVTQAVQWDAIVDQALDRFGRIDILVNNAGTAHGAAIEDETEQAFRRIIDVNQISIFLGMKAVIPAMKQAGAGSIINVSSVLGIAAMPGSLAYAATKFAIRGMTKAAAIDLGASGIRVNSVHPGIVRTALLAAGDSENQLIGTLPLARTAEPEEVSEMMVYLASDESRYCTGSEFIIDGGLTAKL